MSEERALLPFGGTALLDRVSSLRGLRCIHGHLQNVYASGELQVLTCAHQ